MAHMMAIPEEVENAFLNRTIKAFTWVRKSIHLIIGIHFNNLIHVLVIGLVSTTLVLFAFEQIKNNSEDGSKVYESMTTALRCVLEDMRSGVIEADETPTSPFSLT